MFTALVQYIFEFLENGAFNGLAGLPVYRMADIENLIAGFAGRICQAVSASVPFFMDGNAANVKGAMQHE
jgi:hypothetical protein